jgi:hypothetical protein
MDGNGLTQTTFADPKTLCDRLQPRAVQGLAELQAGHELGARTRNLPRMSSLVIFQDRCCIFIF